MASSRRLIYSAADNSHRMAPTITGHGVCSHRDHAIKPRSTPDMNKSSNAALSTCCSVIQGFNGLSFLRLSGRTFTGSRFGRGIKELGMVLIQVVDDIALNGLPLGGHGVELIKRQRALFADPLAVFGRDVALVLVPMGGDLFGVGVVLQKPLRQHLLLVVLIMFLVHRRSPIAEVGVDDGIGAGGVRGRLWLDSGFSHAL